MASQQDIQEIYKVGLNTTRLLMAVGDLIIGWLLLRQAEVALGRAGERRVGQGRRVLHRQGRRGQVVRPEPPAAARR
jgi:hypothetical protein